MTILVLWFKNEVGLKIDLDDNFGRPWLEPELTETTHLQPIRVQDWSRQPMRELIITMQLHYTTNLCRPTYDNTVLMLNFSNKYDILYEPLDLYLELSERYLAV